MEIQYIYRRDGQKVDFNEDKIKNAITKAFVAQGYTESNVDYNIKNITKNVVSRLNDEELRNIEKIQDIIEQEIMKYGYSDVAKAYIIYRSEKERQRQRELLKSIKQHRLKIEDGQHQELVYNDEILFERLKKLGEGLSHLSLKKIVEEVSKNMIAVKTKKDLEKILITICVDKIALHYNYSYLSSRVRLDILYKEILHKGMFTSDFTEEYREYFKQYLHIGIQEEILTSDLKNYDLDIICNAIDPKRDTLFQYLGIQTLIDRYLLKTRSQKIFELPQFLWMRVAMALAVNEEKKEERAIEFYDILSNMYFVNSTPTLFNAGTNYQQLSSCYLNTVEDSLEGIFKNFSDNAQLSKFAGGIGTDFTSVRGTGSLITGTNGKSSGIIPFLKIFNDVALAVNQGGKRKGAMASYLEPWHIDVEEYIELRKNTGDDRRRTHDMHPVLFINDLFMKRVLSGKDWTLFSPDDVPALPDSYGIEFENKYIEYENSAAIKNKKVIKAKDLWRKSLTMLYETGHPWITFKDPCNVRSPQDHVGVVHSSNLCTEITLNTSKDETAVCNLGSLNLAKMIKNKQLDKPLLAKTIKTAIRMLDNVIDINYYPTKEAKKSNLKHRPVGLGIMGYHDALFQMGISFSSNQNLEFADYSMETISYHAILASSELAAEKGVYSTYKGSKWHRGLLPVDTVDVLEEQRGMPIKMSRSKTMNWDKVYASIKKNGMRNSNCLAIAPTATIANICGVIPCVEPIYKNVYQKNNLSGQFTVVNRYLVDILQSKNLWNEENLQLIRYHDGSVAKIDAIPEATKEELKEVFEIEQKWVIRAAANRAKWIDQSASTNIFINTVSGKLISDTYMMAWEYGLKTTYYLRTLADSQVTKTFSVNTTSTIITSEENSCSIENGDDCEVCQ